MAQHHFIDPLFFLDAILEFGVDFDWYVMNDYMTDDMGRRVAQFDKKTIFGSLQPQTGSINFSTTGNTHTLKYKFYCMSKYRINYGDFIHSADNIQQEWCFDKLCLEWVDFIQPYKPSLKDKLCKWMFKKDYPQTFKVRPLDGTLVITSYGNEHYEMVEYSNKKWITDLCFPCEPDKWAYVPEECIKAAHEYIRLKH